MRKAALVGSVALFFFGCHLNATTQPPETIEIGAEADVAAALQAHQLAVEGFREDLDKYRPGTDEHREAAEGLVRNLSGVGADHFILGHNDEALAAYREAIDKSKDILGKDDPDLHWKLAQVYYKLEQFATAVTELEPLVKNERKTDWLYTLAMAYRQTGRNAEAIKLFEEVLKAWPDSYNAAYWLAYTYDLEKNYEKAAETYRKAIAAIGNKDPKLLGQLYSNLGIDLMYLCRKSEAKAAFDEAVKIDKKYAEQLARLAYWRCTAK